MSLDIRNPDDLAAIVDAYEQYEAMDKRDVAGQIYPVIESWNSRSLADETGISYDALSRYMKSSFLEDVPGAEHTAKPTFINYCRIASAGLGERRAWIAELDSFLRDNPGAGLEEAASALGAPKRSLDRYAALHRPEEDGVSLDSEVRDMSAAADIRAGDGRRRDMALEDDQR